MLKRTGDIDGNTLPAGVMSVTGVYGTPLPPSTQLSDLSVYIDPPTGTHTGHIPSVYSERTVWCSVALTSFLTTTPGVLSSI